MVVMDERVGRQGGDDATGLDSGGQRWIIESAGRIQRQTQQLYWAMNEERGGDHIMYKFSFAILR